MLCPHAFGRAQLHGEEEKAHPVHDDDEQGHAAPPPWSQSQLAAVAQVSRATLAEFEAGNRAPYDRTLADIKSAIEKAGIEFIAENGGGAGVRIRKDKVN